jgi:putative tricarboxylic transport membrane protein
MAESPAADQRGPKGILRSPIDLAGGLFLIGIAILGFAGGFNLPFGQLSAIGSGLVPKSVAILVGAFGVALVAQSFFFDGDRLEAWSIRGPIFLLGGVLLFALTIRPWGLILAGPLVIVVTALADKECKPLQLAVLAVAMALIGGLVFKELLGLPIPFDPLGVVPGPAERAYVVVRAETVRLVMSLVASLSR